MSYTAVYLYSKDETEGYQLSDCVNLRFEKERYTPYTTASGVFVCGIKIPFISKVRLYIDGSPVHYGPVDSFEFFTENGISYVKFSSRGFSMGLGQNQPKPGINSSVNLESLISNNIQIPYVGYEHDTAVQNYIYVKESSSLWDAIVALGLKSVGNYPYIYDENTVRLSKHTCDATDLSSADIIKSAIGVNLSSVISDYHMKDTEGEYSFNYTNETAQLYEIVRHKYINLDYQWLYSPDDGLKFKGNFSGKGIKYSFLKVQGYYKLDLRSEVILPEICGESFGTREVSGIRVDYSKSGFSTSLWFYDDAYS